MNRKLLSFLLAASLAGPAVMPFQVFAEPTSSNVSVLKPSMSVSQVISALNSGARYLVLEAGDYSQIRGLSFADVTVYIQGHVSLYDLSLSNTSLIGLNGNAVLSLTSSFEATGSASISNLTVDTNTSIAQKIKNTSLKGVTLKVNGSSTTYNRERYISVSFNANGGSIPSGTGSVQKIELQAHIGPGSSAAFYVPSDPARPGYTFAGWSTDINGSDGSRITGPVYETDKNQTIYAVWQKDGDSQTPEDVPGGRWIHNGNGTYMYQKADGTYLKDTMAFIHGDTYYFSKEGIMLTGFQIINGKTYYFNPSYGNMLKGWQKLDGVYYYFNKSGEMLTGIQQIGNNWYYFAENGGLQTGWQLLDSGWSYFTSNGAMAFGRHTIDDRTYYFSDRGIMAANEFITDDDYTYYFDQAGHMKTGWLKNNNDWYFFASNGVMSAGWIKDQGKWYFLQSNGKMAVSSFIRSDTNTYFVDNSGAMKTGWLYRNSKWYYLQPSGIMAVNTTINGYRFDSNGVCLNP